MSKTNNPAEEIKLEVGGVYTTNVKDLVKITALDEEKNLMHLYNITENCNQRVAIKNHRLVSRKR